jgi:hypothetical protein
MLRLMVLNHADQDPQAWGYVMKRRHKHTLTFEERLKQRAERLRREARGLPLGTKRIELLKRARQAETAAGISRWLAFSHQKPPDPNPEAFAQIAIGDDDEGLSGFTGKASQGRGGSCADPRSSD